MYTFSSPRLQRLALHWSYIWFNYISSSTIRSLFWLLKSPIPLGFGHKPVIDWSQPWGFILRSHCCWCFWRMWFAELSKQSRLHYHKSESIWTTIALTYLKTICMCTYMHIYLLKAACLQLWWERVVPYTTNLRRWKSKLLAGWYVVRWIFDQQKAEDVFSLVTFNSQQATQ